LVLHSRESLIQMRIRSTVGDVTVVHAAVVTEGVRMPPSVQLSERTALYRLYNKRHQLLYVGITKDPRTRFAAHAAEKPWWPEVVRRDLEWFTTRTAALAAEAEAIRNEKPDENLAIPAGPRLRPLRKQSLTETVAAVYREKIFSGELAPGDRLPGEHPLVAEHGIARGTARSVLALLRSEGLVESRWGAGVFVRAPEDRTVAVPVGRPDIAAEMLIGSLAPGDVAALAKLLAEAHGDTNESSP
jgi:DNA-binding transcriptional regulator YhcF (GntR family)/predicted GIY-YIG superfamily endonuclease